MEPIAASLRPGSKERTARMKIGIDPLNVGVSDPASMLALARKVEEVGFESVFTFEHVIIPERAVSPYPYSPKG